MHLTLVTFELTQSVVMQRTLDNVTLGHTEVELESSVVILVVIMLALPLSYT